MVNRTDAKRRLGRGALIAAVIAVLIGGAGVTAAFIITGTPQLENTFSPGRVACEITENFNGTVKTDAAVKNTGDVRAYIRAEIIVTWQDESGNVFAASPVRGTDYSMMTGSGWTVSDGFYYWQDAVDAGQSTGALITEAREVQGRAPEGCHLCIEILGSAVQAEGTDSAGVSPIHDAWKQ